MSEQISSTSAASSNIIKVSEIGMAFGREYYTVLSREPSRLHLFYAKNSTLLHADEGDLDTPISVGSEAIQTAVNKNSFLGSRFIIGSIDCHPSQNGGILVNVLGQIQKRGQAGSARHFMQTFFLAEQPSGYFILNDNMRFLERPEATTPAPVSVTSAASVAENVAPLPVASDEPKVTEASIQEDVKQPSTTETTSVPPSTTTDSTATTAPATKVKKVTTASKQKSTSSSVSPPPSAPVEAEIVPSSPSSWAQLAAVQQNKWASGVVSMNKGTSIQSEEKQSVPSKSASSSSNIRKKNFESSQSTSNQSVNPRRSNDSSIKSPKLPFVPEASLYITGITENLKADTIRAEFAALGALAHFDVKYNSNAAFVEYVDPAIAKILLEEGGIVINGVRLNVEKRRIASRNPNNTNNFSSDSSNKDKDSASKKFIQAKSNRRERPASKSAAPTTA